MVRNLLYGVMAILVMASEKCHTLLQNLHYLLRTGPWVARHLQCNVSLSDLRLRNFIEGTTLLSLYDLSHAIVNQCILHNHEWHGGEINLINKKMIWDERVGRLRPEWNVSIKWKCISIFSCQSRDSNTRN